MVVFYIIFGLHLLLCVLAFVLGKVAGEKQWGFFALLCFFPIFGPALTSYIYAVIVAEMNDPLNPKNPNNLK